MGITLTLRHSRNKVKAKIEWSSPASATSATSLCTSCNLVHESKCHDAGQSPVSSDISEYANVNLHGKNELIDDCSEPNGKVLENSAKSMSIIIVDPLAASRGNKRHLELRQSEIRSQAARSGWHERRKRLTSSRRANGVPKQKPESSLTKETLPTEITHNICPISPDPLRQFCYDLGGHGALKDERYALHLLFEVIAPLTTAISEPLGISNIYGRFMFYHVVQNPDVLHALTAGVLLVLHTHHGQTYPTRLSWDTHKKILMHKVMSIEKLRARLALPDAIADDNAILAILFLALVEDGTGNKVEFDLHMERVRAMIRIRGGISKLNTAPWAQAAVLHLLIANSELGFDEDATFQLQEVCEEVLCTTNMDIEIPSGFKPLVERGIIGTRVIQVINRIMGHTDAKVSNMDSQLNDFQGVFGSFLPLTKTHDSKEPPLSRVVRLAIICYLHLTAIGRGHSICMYHGFSLLLSEVLHEMKGPLLYDERECFIWAWLVAAGSFSLGAGHLGKEGHVLLRDLLVKCPELKNASATRVEEVGKRFLWNTTFSMAVRRNWKG